MLRKPQWASHCNWTSDDIFYGLLSDCHEFFEVTITTRLIDCVWNEPNQSTEPSAVSAD
jgi:hypothetical protein